MFASDTIEFTADVSKWEVKVVEAASMLAY